MKTRTVLLAGAGSQIGVFAIPRLLDTGFEVVAVSRSGPPDGLPALAGVRWVDEAEAIRLAAGCQHLLSAGPLDLALRLVDAVSGLRRAVVFSSTSGVSKQNSPNRKERELAASMLALENELLSGAGGRDLGLSIFRPTLVYGCGLDANISRLAGWVRRYGFLPISNKAAGERQPVHADDLAEAPLVMSPPKQQPAPRVVPVQIHDQKYRGSHQRHGGP